MNEQERARQIARLIEQALQRDPAAASVAPSGSLLARPQPHPLRYTITREGGCLSCDPGACWVCGYLFTGERIVIRHVVRGERVLSDKTLHLLSHGITRYQTKYVVRGEPVIVDLDLNELASYLDT